MRSLVSSPIRWLPLFGLVGIVFAAGAQQPPKKTRPEPIAPIRFTEPESSTPSTNLTDAANVFPGLHGLDTGIRKPFELGNPADSLSGTRAPQNRRVPSAAESKRMKEAIDRKKNWVFLTPEEIYGIQSPEDILHVPEYGPDGEIKQSKGAVDRFMDRMDQERTSAASNQVNSANAALAESEADQDAKTRREENPVLSFLAPANGQPPAGTLSASSTFDRPSSVSISSDSGLSESFNLGPAPVLDDSIARNAAHDANMEQFKQLWNTTARNPAADAATALRSPVLQPNSFAAPSLQAPLVAPSLTPALSPASPTLGMALPGVAPAYTPPPLTKPRYLPPSFEMPKRKF